MTTLSTLSEEERSTELMRLLSGGSGDDKARQLADHLLDAAGFSRQLVQDLAQVRWQGCMDQDRLFRLRMDETKASGMQAWRPS